MTPRSHRATIAPMPRAFTATAQLAAIRSLETVGALTPAMARDARTRIAAAREAMNRRAG